MQIERSNLSVEHFTNAANRLGVAVAAAMVKLDEQGGRQYLLILTQPNNRSVPAHSVQRGGLQWS